MALRIMAYIFRFVDRLKKQKSSYNDIVCSEELQKVKERLVIIAQKVYYPEEYFSLSNNKSIPSRSPLLSLNPFLDTKGLIRVGGRLTNATDLSHRDRHPLILPYKCKMSRLLINFIHQMILHGGNQLMLRVLRTEFSIPRAKKLIRWSIGRCRVCTIMALL